MALLQIIEDTIAAEFKQASSDDRKAIAALIYSRVQQFIVNDHAEWVNNVEDNELIVGGASFYVHLRQGMRD